MRPKTYEWQMQSLQYIIVVLLSTEIQVIQTDFYTI